MSVDDKENEVYGNCNVKLNGYFLWENWIMSGKYDSEGMKTHDNCVIEFLKQVCNLGKLLPQPYSWEWYLDPGA